MKARLLAFCAILFLTVSGASGQAVYQWSNFAGSPGGSGDADGTGSDARFDTPSGVAVDGAGNLFIADSANHVIRKIGSGGLVTTLAGSPGAMGSADGTGSAARFSHPGGVALDGQGNLYVADTGSHTIRKITSDGVVTTVAGVPWTAGSVDGVRTDARFHSPGGVAVDPNGNLVVADTGNHVIRRITSDGVVSTLAGAAGMVGSADGAWHDARFYLPKAVAVDAAGNVYVADGYNYTIRKITPDGGVSTFAGTARSYGGTDGMGSAARFYGPSGVAVDGSGNVYVADGDDDLRKITPAGLVSTMAGTPGSTLKSPGNSGVAVDKNGTVYVTDSLKHTIIAFAAAGPMTLAGSAAEFGSADGTGSAARFNGPAAVAVDADGNLYVADNRNHVIRKISKFGEVSTLAGSAGLSGSADGTGSAARFKYPYGVAVDGSGNVYVADSGNYTIRKITSAGVVTTLAGTAGSSGSADGIGNAARFYFPFGVAVDGSGNLYVSDSENHTIRKITSTGEVSTLAGRAGSHGSTDGTGSAAGFNYPEGVAVDASGNVYVADEGNQAIRRITSAGTVSTLAGSAGSYGSADGTGSAAQFHNPIGVAVDGSGTVYVADLTNETIRKVTPAGVVSTLGGAANQQGNQPGLGRGARFNSPLGIAVGADGSLYVAGGGNPNIVVGRLGPDIIVEQQLGSPLTGGASTVNWGAAGSLRVFTLRNDGASDVTGLAVSIDGTPMGNAAADFVISAPLRKDSLAPGASATFAVTFKPSAFGTRTATLHLVSSEFTAPFFSVTLAGIGDVPGNPVLSPVTIASSNANPAWARAGDIITFHFTSNEALQSPVVFVGPDKAAVSGAGTDWTATLAVTATSTQGPVSFRIEAKDLAGNPTTVTATTNGSSVTIDTKPPSTVTPPASVTAEATGPDGALVAYQPATAIDAGGPVTIAYSHASGTRFPLGRTTVYVTATDAAGNTAVPRNFSVTVQDTTAPAITGSFTPLILFEGEPVPDYLPQARFSDLSGIVWKGQNPPAGTIITSSLTRVTLGATDGAGNPGTTGFSVEVRSQAKRNELVDWRKAGDLLGSYAGGLPADARFVSYGDPALDDAGTVAYAYTWASPTAGRGVALSAAGISLFAGQTLIAGAVGVGDVGTPVIDGGHVAVLGTLRRTAAPTVGVIFDRPAGGALSTALRTLNDAPGTGGATFKDFAQIGVARSSLAFVAHLALNTGLPKTTAASDTGVWAQDATHALKLLLREGQDVGGKTVRTLVTFQPGNGSPGQGRGWVLHVNGVTQVHALVTFTDSTQALLKADNEGHLTTLSSTGLLGAGRPTLAGATFASYSFPALNALGDHAFLGTLTTGAAGVTLQNNRGIFLNDPATGSYDAVVRIGDQATGAIGVTAAAGASFSTLYDPVLNDDGSVAFRSLLAGVKAGNHDSVWWQPAGGGLQLLAQEGTPPAGSNVATEKWLSFTSLAIRPGGGPIFTATVTGGVTGVWAVDYTGALRPLFRTGDLIEGRQLTGFSILKALPGTMGTTRSFNRTQLLVWRATFKDGTTGIVETVLP